MSEEPPAYAIRLSSQAKQDILEASVRLTDMTQQPALAGPWATGLYNELARLATHPARYPLAQKETRLFKQETRQMIYRRASSAVAYRILFTIAEDTDDGPTVIIIHVRHGSRRPPTREEARQIITNQ